LKRLQNHVHVHVSKTKELLYCIFFKKKPGQMSKPYVDIECTQGEWAPSSNYNGSRQIRNNFVIRVWGDAQREFANQMKNGAMYAVTQIDIFQDSQMVGDFIGASSKKTLWRGLE
jgi:hypothetical protein